VPLEVALDRLPPDTRPVATLTPAELEARVLHLDPWLVVIDKPQGLAVHAGPASADHLERHLDALRFGYAAPPQLAHRLDRDTSGCLALGRHRRALKRLGRLFETGQVTKTYWAVVAGVPDAAAGTIDLPISKRNEARGWRMVIDEKGRRAVTDYVVKATDGRRSWLELTPRTGRTHQLRIHCASLGFAIAGDGFYAAGEVREGPLLLHARSLVLPMQADAPPVHALAPPPAPLAAALRALAPEARF
jgi:tRNA pseudouridine32 synthase/23S rRNA pseudouridine746 synthase/23S rRNA pseudouridine1911/1915/1917 synthase